MLGTVIGFSLLLTVKQAQISRSRMRSSDKPEMFRNVFFFQTDAKEDVSVYKINAVGMILSNQDGKS